MIHADTDAGVEQGFVSIETAERMRQQATIAEFREKHPEQFRRLLDATIGLKRAHQELEEAKVAARALPTDLPMSDILDGVEREARAALKEASSAATAQQLAQVNAEHAGSTPAAAPTGKKAKAA